MDVVIINHVYDCFLVTGAETVGNTIPARMQARKKKSRKKWELLGREPLTGIGRPRRFGKAVEAAGDGGPCTSWLQAQLRVISLSQQPDNPDQASKNAHCSAPLIYGQREPLALAVLPEGFSSLPPEIF